METSLGSPSDCSEGPNTQGSVNSEGKAGMEMVAEAGNDVLVLVIMVNSESAIHGLIGML